MNPVVSSMPAFYKKYRINRIEVVSFLLNIRTSSSTDTISTWRKKMLLLNIKLYLPMHYIKKRLILRGRIKVGKRPSNRHANVRKMTARCPVTYIVKNL